MRFIISILFCFLLSACGDLRGGNKRQVENYGDITNGPGNKSLVIPEEHQGGWGRRDCLMCHNVNLNVHRKPDSVLDADSLNEIIRRNGESEYCLSCHGPNGVE